MRYRLVFSASKTSTALCHLDLSSSSGRGTVFICVARLACSWELALGRAVAGQTHGDTGRATCRQRLETQ